MNVLLRVAWGALAAWAVAVGAMTIVGLGASNSAPQETAVGAIGCALVVVPYVLLRAVDKAAGR